MGTIAEKLTYLQGTKQAIRAAITAKGVAVSDADTFRGYADKIGAIPQSGGSAAQDWFAYLENALSKTETSTAYRHIQLVTDIEDSFSVTATNGNAGMVWYTSDGAVLPWVASGVSHTWDKSKDIPFDGDFKVRWIICSMTGPAGYPHTMNDALYSVVDKLEVSNNSIYKAKKLLRGVKFIGGAGWRSTLTTMNYAMFNGCASLVTMDGMDFQYVTAAIANNSFSNSLVHIRNMGSVKTALDLSGNALLTHDSLMEVIGALHDVSGGTAQKLTLGAGLLAGLTDAEKAIATGKGWTLA